MTGIERPARLAIRVLHMKNARALRSVFIPDEVKSYFENIEEKEILLEMELRISGRENEKRRKILEWLSTIEFIKHHDTALEDLLENTGLWLLKKERFRQRRSYKASGTLWLRGIPGAGKTKLT
ncbi:hypothetical protein DFP73DRAFT_593288 [Morchella snyderi]|nr:hypothetical protein DFP73DRAFT_593288 [Morchella snyderi]